jgi:5-methylcytosine-specific restriction endonuclease McrA
MPTPPKPKPTKIRRKAVPPGLRFDVLVRDKFRCRACGVGAKEARLEIDHIIPVSKGGLTTLKNLQVLCRSCNRGKSAKLRAVKAVANKLEKAKRSEKLRKNSVK